MGAAPNALSRNDGTPWLTHAAPTIDPPHAQRRLAAARAARAARAAPA